MARCENTEKGGAEWWNRVMCVKTLSFGGCAAYQLVSRLQVEPGPAGLPVARAQGRARAAPGASRAS